MSFFTTVSNFFSSSSSKKTANNKINKIDNDTLNNLGEEAIKLGEKTTKFGEETEKVEISQTEGSKDFSYLKSFIGIGIGLKAYPLLSGYLSTANASMQIAKFFSNTVSPFANAVKFLAVANATNPVAFLAATVTTSILASNPQATFNAIKKFSSTVYDYTTKGAELLISGVESIAKMLDADNNKLDTGDSSKLFDNCSEGQELQLELAGEEFSSIGEEVPV